LQIRSHVSKSGIVLAGLELAVLTGADADEP
jgi:hypothetical protein